MSKTRARKTARATARRASKATRGPGRSIVSADSGPSVEDLAELGRYLVAIGAPPEALEALTGPGGPEAAARILVEVGLLPSADEAFDGLMEGFRPLLKAGIRELDAELAGMEFLGQLAATAPDPDDIPALLADMVVQAEACRRREALAFLRILAAVGPGQVRLDAAAAAGRLVMGGLTDPRWVARLGTPEFDACYGYADIFGAQEALAVTFRYGNRRHTLCVLIDHDLGGGVKDCWVSDRSDRIHAEYRNEAGRLGLDLEDHEPSRACEILDRALSRPPCPEQADQVEDTGDYLDLLRQRVDLLRTMPVR